MKDKLCNKREALWDKLQRIMENNKSNLQSMGAIIQNKIPVNDSELSQWEDSFKGRAASMNRENLEFIEEVKESFVDEGKI